MFLTMFDVFFRSDIIVEIESIPRSFKFTEMQKILSKNASRIFPKTNKCGYNVW